MYSLPLVAKIVFSPMEKICCSVPILTLNRKEQLTRVLPQLIEYFDDVFLIDGNSTDGTQEYAKSLGVRVERQFDANEPNKEITDFRQARIASWALCKNDWIFFLDSDEVPTEELLILIRTIVEQNDTHVVHRVMRHIRMPDGRIIKHSPFYATPNVRLFALSSGVTLADRKVHERFVIPEGVSVIDHDEAIICPESDPWSMRERNLRYIELEAQSLKDASWKHFWKWIVWYNLKSTIGQCIRIFIERVENVFRAEPSLPWSYNYVFIRYRFDSCFALIRAWRALRMKEKGIVK